MLLPAFTPEGFLVLWEQPPATPSARVCWCDERLSKGKDVSKMISSKWQGYKWQEEMLEGKDVEMVEF